MNTINGFPICAYQPPEPTSYVMRKRIYEYEVTFAVLCYSDASPLCCYEWKPLEGTCFTGGCFN